MFAIRYPEDLPICARRAEIAAAILAHQVVIVAGETGSGKTTQLPKICLEAGLGERGQIGCTQPRRVAALGLSKRVAEELGVAWGAEVGCKMRFSDETGRLTRIKFMTDGILLAELQSDPLLRRYSTLIIDEAHERSLNIDFLLGYLNGLLKKRGDLKLVITSATIDTDAFSKAFGGAPVIEVSGRIWPVEIRYAPMEESEGADAAEFSHVDAAVAAAEDALIESDSGDILIFMPTERDIRDARELLEGRLGAGTEIICIFGRMPGVEQQRIFTPGDARRVVVATNIAETSLTLPRIRYVIDTGLARMSRYNPRTRTKRLPVESISQSSANQRAGRSGRVREGVCIRLYSQEDFDARPKFTQPEIQRANLAEVILRMKAFQLGEIETFPFLNPPQSAAIRAGRQLLHELGALNDAEELTVLGDELARLPIDPTLGRMLLQAREEGALAEVLVVAAGLSVPDPRERPDDRREAAAAAHREFCDAESDFLSMLNLWRSAPASEGKGAGNALRRFCKSSFLSVSRMREWRDIQRQLADAMLEENRPAGARRRERPPSESEFQENRAAIHRSILSGLLGHVAQRQERNIYKASGNRLTSLFPGSGLFERREKAKKAKPAKDVQDGGADPAAEARQPQWIMAAEIVETSQLFARTAAGIQPEWIVELGVHLCNFRHSEPHWSEKAGRVLAVERVLIHGLEVARRLVDYGRIDAAKATELFIRGALVAGETRIPHRFFAENRKVLEKVETALTRVRSPRALDLDESLYRYYSARIEGVSSVHDLNVLVRARIGREPNFLHITEEDLIGGESTYDRAAFPDRVAMANAALPLSYSYSPGEESDGVTIKVPLPLAQQLTSGQLQWMVPGLREEQIGALLRALPKAVRKRLMPLEPKVREIAEEFDPDGGEFLQVLAAFLSRKYAVPLSASDWTDESLPQHLRPRVEVIDAGGNTVAAGRDLAAIRSLSEAQGTSSAAWERAAAQWERHGLKEWNFGDLPETTPLEKVAGTPLVAYPGLASGDTVDLRLFRTRKQAEAAAPAAIRKLGELVLARDLARLWKDLAAIAQNSRPKSAQGFHDALNQLGDKVRKGGAISQEGLQTSAYQNLLDHCLLMEPIFPLTAARFHAMVESARRDLPVLTFRLMCTARQILELREAILSSSKRHPGLEQDIERLAPPDFLAKTPHAQLQHLPRYLKAVQIRAERAFVRPAKDSEKAARLAEVTGLETRVPTERRETFRWMLEEFRVSLFAQELGTAEPVSAQRLKELCTPTPPQRA